MDTEHRPDQEQNQEEYAFIQEVIKDEKNDKNKWTSQIGRWASIGLIFGIFACIGFFTLKPLAENVFRKNPNKVEIPKDDIIGEEDVSDEDSGQQAIVTIEDYRELNDQMNQVAIEAEKSIVRITGIKQDENWGNGQHSFLYQTTGLIVADNGPELLILTNYSDIKEAELFRVTFADGKQHEAVMKQKDGNSNLAVFSVAKNEIAEGTWNKIKVATLGNSNVFTRGSVLIALGNPFGYEESVGYGVASSVDKKILLADGEYRILVTDMPKAKQSNGFLFDSYGNVMGIIIPEMMEKEGPETLAAIGISAVKNEIELMSNGKNVAYVGIIGTIVTKEMSEMQGIPAGLYVTEVEVDSPAMKAGIQSGDVITKIENKEIATLSEYHSTLIGQEAGKMIILTGQRYGGENYVDIKFNVTVGVKQ